MADRAHVPVPLSSMTGGINRFTDEARADQCADARDVIADRGELRRRDSFAALGSGPPHLLPAGATYVVRDGATVADRRPDFANCDAVLIGCAHPFDGFDLRFPTTDTVPAEHRELVLEFWDGSAWVEIPFFVDETRDFVSDVLVTLQKRGRVYWHTDAFIDDWATSAQDGTTAYWIRVSFTDAEREAAKQIGASDMTPDAPGVRVFVFAAVTGLFPVRIENRACVVIGADRSDRDMAGTYASGDDHRTLAASGLERGAQLGAKREDDGETEIAVLLEDEGPGFYGKLTWPQPTRSTGGVASNVGSAGLFEGADNVFTKTRTELYNRESGALVPYDWGPNTWRGGPLSGSLTPVGTFAASTVRVTASGSGLSDQSGFYRHCRIRCTARSGAGPQVDEEREIVAFAAGTTNVFSVYPDWSATPDANNRFVIHAPHTLVLPPNLDDVRSWGEAFASDDDTITFSTTGGYVPSAAAWAGWQGHFRLGRELRWVVDGSRGWSAIVDVITGRLICTNGPSGLLEYDGTNLRRLQADFTTAGARQYVGALADQMGLDANSVAVNPGALLRRHVPAGAYVVQHQTRIFVAGDPTSPFVVRWSAPGGSNNVWPMGYEDMIRDQEGDGIVGMATLDERLVVFTPTALHEAVGPDERGRYSFAALTRGLGFVGHRAVCVLAAMDGASRLAGISADGIYAWAGGEPTVLLDRWDRLIEGGVNVDRLHRAVACAAPQQSLAFFAVPHRGSSSNDRILVLDYLRGRWWVWSAPFGVSAIAVDYDGDGRERVLFGTEDGFVQTLTGGVTDDGEAIEAFATTLPVEPFGGAEAAVSGYTLSAKTAGVEEPLTVALLDGGDTDGEALSEGDVVVSAGEPAWGSDTWNTVRWAASKWKTIREPVPNNTRTHQLQMRIEGAARWVVGRIEVLMKPRSRSGR